MPLIDLDAKQAVTNAESGLARWDAQLKAAPGDQFQFPAEHARRCGWHARCFAWDAPNPLSHARVSSGHLSPDAGANSRMRSSTRRSAVFAFRRAGAALAAGRHEAEARAAVEEAACWGNRLLTDQPHLVQRGGCNPCVRLLRRLLELPRDRVQARTWWERSRQHGRAAGKDPGRRERAASGQKRGSVQSNHDITRILIDWDQDPDAALDRLTPLVYDELRRIAAGCLRIQRPGHTLQPTALVHEAYLKLRGRRIDSLEGSGALFWDRCSRHALHSGGFGAQALFGEARRWEESATRR
jgi:hypothetical protein